LKANLPDDAACVLIAGSNHAGFGDYGVQRNDLEAMISQSMQWAGTVETLLARVGG